MNKAIDTKDKLLFTPGPLTTSLSTKMAMLTDVGSRDEDFASLVKSIENRLLRLAQCNGKDYAAILTPGSGTYGVESVISSALGEHESLLILENGAYGKRMQSIAQAHKINYQVMSFPEDQVFDVGLVEKRLSNTCFQYVAMVHCETSAGVLNPLEEIGRLCKNYNVGLIVDAMSSFGGIPIHVPDLSISFLVSSANKCIEGVPGFSFVIAEIEKLNTCEGKSRTLSLDLYEQYRAFLHDGRFRFTPPTHAILAFSKALDLLDDEGGVVMRNKRYQENHLTLVARMEEMGFSCFVKQEHQSPIITTFCYPDTPLFNFEDFYQRLKSLGFVIYQGKLSHANCFRVGCIGHLFAKDVENLVSAIKRVCMDMGISLLR